MKIGITQKGRGCRETRRSLWAGVGTAKLSLAVADDLITSGEISPVALAHPAKLPPISKCSLWQRDRRNFLCNLDACQQSAVNQSSCLFALMPIVGPGSSESRCCLPLFHGWELR